MGIKDAFGGGGDELAAQLIDQNQPDDGQPYSSDPIVLTDRLARKMAVRGRQPRQPEFDFTEPEEKAPDLSSFGKKVETAEPVAESTEDLSSFGKRVESPAAAPPAGMTVAREAKAALKGIPHGAVSTVGGALKGAAAVYDNGIPATPEMPQYDAQGNPLGTQSEPAAAVPAAPLKDRSLYKAGQATEDFAQRIAPMSEQEKDSIGGRVGMGAGGLAVYGAAALAAGPLAGLGAAAGGMALDTYGKVFEASKEAGKTDEEANSTAGKSAMVAGVLGALPLGAGKLATGLIAKAAVSAGAFTTLGEAQEWILQELAKDYDPKAGYSLDHKRIIASLILGAGVGGLHHAFERDPNQPQQPGQQPPGAQPAPPGAQMPPPGPNPNSSNGPGSGPNAGGPQPNAGSGPHPGAGPNQGQGPNTGGPSGTGGPGQQGKQAGSPPPGSGQGKASDPNYTMDPATRAKMERVYRMYEQGKDPAGMTDGELYDAVNEHLRDTSSTGYTAKPETAEEAAAREAKATEREQNDVLKKAGWTDAHINAMTPEQRQKYYDRATGKAQPEQPAPEQPARPAEKATTSPDDVTASKGASNPTENLNTPENSTIPHSVKTGDGTRAKPIAITSAADIAAVEKAASADYTHAQGEANNRQLGHATWNDLPVSMEVAKGGTRKMVNPETGEPVEVTHAGAAYGYIKGTKGADGMHVDLYMGDKPESPHVFVVDEKDRDTGKFRQHKVMAGFDTERDAFAAYVQTSTKGMDTVGGITPMSVPQLKQWLAGDTTKPLKKEAGAGVITPQQPASAEQDLQRPLSGGTSPAAADAAGPQTARQPVRSKTAANLLQFLAGIGGVKPHPELDVMDAAKHQVEATSFGAKRKLVREGGLDLDRAREAAEEAGYFRGNEDGTGTIAEFLDAIDDGIRGQHRYPEGHEGTVTKREASADAERTAHENAQADELVAELEVAGHGEIGAELKAKVLHLMASENLDPDTAVDRAIAELDREDDALTASEFDDTYGPGAYDEILSTFSPESRVDDQPEGIGRDRGEENPPDGPRATASPASKADGANAGNDAGRQVGSDRSEPNAGREAGDQAVARSAEDTSASERPSVDDFIAHIESEIAAGRTDADISPTRSLKEFQEAAEARGWTYGAYGKGKALWSPDRSHVIFASVSVEGNHVTAQWATPSDGITPPGGEPAESGSRNREWALRQRKKGGFKNDQTIKKALELADDIERAGGSPAYVDGIRSVVANGTKIGADGLKHYQAELDKLHKDHRDAPTWAEVLAELPMHSDGRTRQHEIAFDIIKEMTGIKKPTFNKLTPSEKVELLARVKARKEPAPVPTTETGVDNKPQTVLPGAEKAPDAALAQRAAAAPLKPKVAQKSADDGLFGDGHKQTDLLDMVAKKPKPPADDFDSIFDAAIDAEFGPKPALDIDQVADGLKKLFGKGLAEAEIAFDDTKYEQALPFFKAGVQHFAAGGADLTTMVRSLVRHLSVAGMDADAIRAMKPYIKRFTDDVTAGRETIDAPSSSTVLERDSGKPVAGDAVGGPDVQSAAGGARRGDGERGSKANAGDKRPRAGERLPQDYAPVLGAEGNFELPPRESEPQDSDAADRDEGRGDENREGGFSFDDTATDEAVRNAQQQADLKSRRDAQQKADARKIPWKEVNPSNIADSLPMLFPEQQADVLAAEQRFAKTEGHGMLFTNGTGTGKTYSGLGVIKRFFQKGTPRTLVVAPSQGILMDWQKSAKDLGLDMHILDSTVDKGRGGLNATTYANLGENPTLADGEWALVVADEAHKLSSDKDGTTTKALQTFRALTLHPDGLQQRARMVLRKEWEAVEKAEGQEKVRQSLLFNDKAQPLIDKWKDEQRPKALMMSATPFAYHFSLDYAEGYLFDYDRSEDTKGGYNRGDGRDKFYMQHLGYRMRTNRLTKPDADVQSEIMERQLHEYLKSTGSLAGRALTVDKDYDRKFMLVHEAIGQQIDQGLQFLQDNEEFRPLYDYVAKKFDYLTRMRLLEAIKARAAVPIIKQNLALGRKVVVFHDYNEGGGINPFDLMFGDEQKASRYKDGKHEEVALKPLYEEFVRQNPYVKDLKFSSYRAPIAELTAAFPDAMVYNGTVPVKKRNAYKAMFNDDASGKDLIIVQSAAGEAGISLHDTTGKHQRVLLNLGMPIRPTTSIQQEGRIYRVGQASDALFRYMSTGTDWERWTFAGKIAERAGTAENLALGNLARTIRQSFVDAFSNADEYPPEPGEGKGGKETDRATSESVSEFTKAKTHYFANSKTTGKRSQREGVDYYATPEPIGLKMVEFANVKPGEKMLEPSAGHGAIARYFPEVTARTLVEPSSSLASRAALTSPGARVVVDRFENLDTAANKFDAIVMNPPFGTAGATAIEHLAKAVKHLKNGGRIVALIPRGSTDAKFDKFMDSPAGANIYLVGDINLPSVAFERAGTSISARVVVLDKHLNAKNVPQQRSRDYSGAQTIMDLFDAIEHTEMPARNPPEVPEIDIPTEGKVTINDVEFKLETSSDKMRHMATLKGFAGPSKFRTMVRAAEDNGGEYVKTAKTFRFKTVEQRQAFLDAFANPPAEKPAAAAAPGAAPAGVTFTTGETTHAKTGEKLFVATANERVASDVYSQLNAAAKANGGYYSSFRGRGAIPGFQFKSEENRARFLGSTGAGLASPETDALMARLIKDAIKPVEKKPAGQRGQEWTLEEGRRTGNESLIAYDANGKAIARIQGRRRFVDFTHELRVEMMKPENDIVLHHNHPENGSLSQPDLMTLAFPGVNSVWAHGHNSNTFRAAMTPEFAAVSFPSPPARSKKIEQVYAHALWRLQPIMQEALTERTIGTDEANFGIIHLVNEILADAGIIDYRHNVSLGDLVSRTPGLDVTIANAVVAARKEAFGDKANLNRVDRPTGDLRHPGDMGATFERSAEDAGLTGEGRSTEDGEQSHFYPEGEQGLAAPPNSFDKTVGDILRTRLLGRLGELNATEARVQLQDKFIRIKKAEDSVGAPSDQSAYQAESLYYGRTGQRLEALTEHHIDPIIREMKARDIDLDSFDDFLYARHAPERNQKLADGYTPGHDFYEARTNPDIVGASGWSTNHALGIIRAIRQKGKLADYMAVARMIDALNAKTRRTLYDAGLIDRATLDAWNSAYKYYVPLRGWAEGSEHGESIAKQGSGMNIRGKEAKTAFGRKSEAASPTAYSIMQAELAIVRAEKNKVGNVMHDFVRANPDPTRWTINRREGTKRFDPNTGLVTTVPNNMPMLRDNEFVTKRNGKEVVIQFHGPDGLNLARALNNMGTANVHKLIRAYAQVTHTMAKMATAWNPEFMIPNLIRDAGEAFVNLTPQQQKNFVRNFAKHLPGAMVGSSRAIAGKGAGDRYVEAFKRYDEAGGRIRFFGIEDPDAIEQNVSKKLARLQGGALNTIKDIGDTAAKALEVAGGGIENATRLAAFMAAEDAGFSQADAAMLARNLTVDFNKKGELGGAIGSLYMFANAGIQGQARMIRALGHRQVWAAIGALAGAAALSTLYSIWASNVDETGTPDYMKIPSWERDRNLIFMFGDNGRYMKVPLPYGFSMFAVAASRAVIVMLGHEKPGKAAHAVMDSVINAFNPLGEESTTVMDIVPSALRPAFHIAFNKNWTGKPLYPEPDKNRGQMPASTQSYRTNSAFSKEAAKQMNEWSGGSPYKSGAVDVHPGSIDHTLQALGGGVGRFVKGIADSFYHNTIEGGEWQPEKTPILRRFTGKVGEEADRAFYYEQRQEALDKKAAINRAKNDLKNPEMRESAQELLRESSKDNTRTAIFKSADEQMKKLRQQEEQVRNSDQTPQSKQDALTIIRSNMRKIQNEARGKVKRMEPAN